MGSKEPPKKCFKTSASNPASNITSFKSLGLSFQEANDTVIHRYTSGDGQTVKASTTAAPPIRRLYNSVDNEGDWDAYGYDEDNQPGGPSQSFFQVKKGQVSKVQQNKLFASVCVGLFIFISVSRRVG
jgi:hypothetical protein